MIRFLLLDRTEASADSPALSTLRLLRAFQNCLFASSKSPVLNTVIHDFANATFAKSTDVVLHAVSLFQSSATPAAADALLKSLEGVRFVPDNFPE